MSFPIGRAGQCVLGDRSCRTAKGLSEWVCVCVRLIQSLNEWKSITKDWAAVYWRIADERRGRRNYETLEMTLLFFPSVSSFFRSSHSHVMRAIQESKRTQTKIIWLSNVFFSFSILTEMKFWWILWVRNVCEATINRLRRPSSLTLSPCESANVHLIQTRPFNR